MSPAPADELSYKPLDGGWGWMVVVGAHISIGFAYSTPKALSIFFNEIQEDLGASYSEIAWISSIMLAVMYAGGPVSSVLVSRFGSRPIVILGGLMCGVSMVTASFESSITYLYFCIGIIGGCGLSLNLNASLTIISKYFLAKRPLANGLAMAGSPVFLCFLAPVNQYLLVKFGWRGSLLILGGLMLNCCVAGALMRPVIPPCKPSPCVPQKKVEEQPNKCNTKLKERCMKNAKKFLDLSFFKDRGFVIYLIGNVMFIFGAYAPIMFLSAYAINRGVEEYSAAYLLSIMGFVDMFVRPGTGLLANSKWIRPRIQYFFSFAMVFNGMCHLLCPLIKSYAFLVVYAVFFGVSFGMIFALIFECLMDLMGTQRFPSAVGLVTIIECFPMLLGPPAAGLLVDIFGDYKYLFFMCGSVIMTGGLFLFVMNIYNYHMLEKEKTAKDREQNQKTIENQDQVSISEAGMKQIPEAAMERTEPEAKEKNGIQKEPWNAETPN
ncbi:monocarboxylate transporter 2-like [Siniperca chuatsi]|uniref:monocarboxylate transporter 2-like n=1 Tax=Siniperca chuatsi TaxID=119488 RepID=UPI001CE1F3D1|nr:monocarboxylate transporter 2-like [Siniperca chuatsi]XP_044022129.1 monocarboxylate transporter 2-like [Siniperca chuatsi]